MKKTIVITVDETTLVAIDRLARGSGRRLPGKRANRSEVVRRAVQEFVARHQRLEREEKDRRILGARRDLIERQAAALVAGQAGRARPPARC
jgi:Arc/MetJ-type ribon-helix-helix transcriptional regulator